MAYFTMRTGISPYRQRSASADRLRRGGFVALSRPTHWAAAMLLAAFVSIGYGPSGPAPAANSIAATCRRRNATIFSIKQASVPMRFVAVSLLPPIALWTSHRPASSPRAPGAAAVTSASGAADRQPGGGTVFQPALARPLSAGRCSVWSSPRAAAVSDRWPASGSSREVLLGFAVIEHHVGWSLTPGRPRPLGLQSAGIGGAF